ncbi:MAG TPA: response regulator [Flavobacterium sp.]|jgi:CheY-like chemotaxis protein
MTENRTIFYADDDEDDLMFFKEAIEEMHYNAFFFDQAGKMLYAMHNPPPKPYIVFIDLNMPGLDGYDLIKDIRKTPEFNDTPIVILSTADEECIIKRCRELGANYYVTKANALRGLQKSIEHVMGIDWKNFRPTKEEFAYRPHSY